jgi:hypothetical protein
MLLYGLFSSVFESYIAHYPVDKEPQNYGFLGLFEFLVIPVQSS